MALPWSDLTISDVTGIGTTELFTSTQTMDGNQVISGTVALTGNTTDDYNVTINVKRGGGTSWAQQQIIKIDAGDTEPIFIGPLTGFAEIRIGAFRVSGSNSATLQSFLARANMNGA